MLTVTLKIPRASSPAVDAFAGVVEEAAGVLGQQGSRGRGAAAVPPKRAHGPSSSCEAWGGGRGGEAHLM